MKRLIISLIALWVILGVLPDSLLARIKRSTAARRQFKQATGYPNGRPGYIIDHIIPLACGGADDTSNMQWQTKEEARAKDRVELACMETAAYRPRSYSSRNSRAKNVRVSGYRTKSGRYVAPYYRSRPSRRRR